MAIEPSAGSILKFLVQRSWCVNRPQKFKRLAFFTFAALLVALVFPRVRTAAQDFGTLFFNLQPFLDPSGAVATYNSAGNIDRSNPFFAKLGTNGRTCETCHEGSDAMSITPLHLQERFILTRGADAIFESVDGANCPNSPAKQNDPSAHSLLLQHGLIRIFEPMPANPEFTIAVVHDPYGCAMLTDPSTGIVNLSVYRRPLPATNLRYLSALMFDGRETVVPLNAQATFGANILQDLTHQAQDAVNTHAQANPPNATDPNQLAALVQFEMGLTTAQFWDNKAGFLNAMTAGGGPVNLSNQTYYPGTNDVLGADPTGLAFNESAMTIFDPWENLKSGQRDPGDFVDRTAARKAIARGEIVFNTAPLVIQNVRGLNDNPSLPNPLAGTCTSCHDTPNVGDHSTALPLDIGTSHIASYEHDPQIASALAELDFPDVPIYKVTGCPNPFATTSSAPTSFYTADPGKALVTGKCADFNRGKGPILRGLAARAPYFHDGAAKDLTQIVNFYNLRFQMNLTSQQKSDLVAFLNSL
jgi:cytochrome c peroxidase